MTVAVIGTEAALAPTIGAVIGLFLDRRFGWSPWGLLVGFGVGVFGAVQLLRELAKRTDENGKD
jgi:F0F1-type ATP synthase assembly protein I